MLFAADVEADRVLCDVKTFNISTDRGTLYWLVWCSKTEYKTMSLLNILLDSFCSSAAVVMRAKLDSLEGTENWTL